VHWGAIKEANGIFDQLNKCVVFVNMLLAVKVYLPISRVEPALTL
jgi:hypothetical protein